MEMPFTDNGIKLNFPDNNCFRFEDLAIMKKIKPYSFTDVDACWFDIKDNTFYCIELKNFYRPEIEKYFSKDFQNEDIISEFINELYRKTIDCMCMIASGHLGTCSEIKNAFHPKYNLNSKTRIIHIINPIPKDEFQFTFLNQKLKSKIEGHRILLGMHSVTIITYTQAKEIFNWVN